jgi:ABC-type amino acid transport substrate-binding protein/cbb3-type cytochrome oxidase subunit 3
LAIAAKPQSESQTLLFIQNIFSLDFLKAVLLLFLVIFIFGLIIWAFERRKNHHFENNGKGLFSGIWFSAVTMTTVGYGDKAPVTNGGKLFTLIWMFTAIIIISGFTASIAASLTVDQLDNSITELSELKRIEVGTVAASSSQTYLEKHEIKVSTFADVEEGLEALSNNEIDAFVYDEPLLRFKLEAGSYHSDIKVLPYTFNTQYYSLSFPKNSELVDLVNPELLRIIKTDGWGELVEKYGLGE